jgi:hypothetical protein
MSTLQSNMSSPSIVGSAGCSFWSARLSFTSPISARHYCLLGNNRYAAPATIGVCNDNDPTAGSTCRECFTWDGSQTRDCFYMKGGQEMGMIPPTAGYPDPSCSVGFELFTNVYELEIACPMYSVLMLEIFPTVGTGTARKLQNEVAAATNWTVASDGAYYDFHMTTSSPAVTREWEARQCLTGVGGRGCGAHTMKLLAFHQDGNCQLDFVSGTGYKIHCDNGFDEASSLLGGSRRQDCHAYNGLSCLEVMQHQPAALANTNIIIVGGEGNDRYKGLCGIHEWGRLSNAVAWLVGIGIMLLTLIPSFSCFRAGSVGPLFLVGLLSEAFKNMAVVASIISVDWECLQQYGLIIPSGNSTVFLPYGLIAFSMGDMMLVLIALFSKRHRKALDSFEKFKWLGESSTPHRRIMTFVTMTIFGGLGGFMHLTLILHGTVESAVGPTGSNLMSTWASWTFIVSAAVGGFAGTLMILAGLYTGKMRTAWKTYKLLVGDIPGLVCAYDLAVVLSPGWTMETFNDVLHIVIGVPALWAAYKASR